ncbi:MAG: FkbM family methyltransferase [Bacteroidota bacterium]
MKNFFFTLFRIAQRALKGTGLGKVPFLKRTRDAFYTLLRPNDITQIEIEGFKLFVDPTDEAIGKLFLVHTRYEQAETDLIKSILKPGNTFVDVGANIGYYSLLASQCVGEKGKVYSFEPAPNNFSLLQKNIAANKLQNIIATQKAIAEKQGILRLFMDEHLSGGHQIFDSGLKSHSVDVETISLDEFFLPKNVKIDLLKIDIEGAEMFALEGVKKTIASNPTMKLITEFYPVMIERCGFSPEKYLEVLRGFGFTLSIIDEEKHSIVPADNKEVFSAALIDGTTNLLCAR